MKAAICSACLLAFMATQAQSTRLPLTGFRPKVRVAIQPGDTTFAMPKFNNLGVVAGRKVVRLPQDGMPCLVPDTQALAPMPNPALAWKTPPAAHIPNPFVPNKGSGKK